MRGGDAALAREQALEAEARDLKPYAAFLAPAILALAELELGQRGEAHRLIEQFEDDPASSWGEFRGQPDQLAHRALFAEARARLGD